MYRADCVHDRGCAQALERSEEALSWLTLTFVSSVSAESGDQGKVAKSLRRQCRHALTLTKSPLFNAGKLTGSRH